MASAAVNGRIVREHRWHPCVPPPPLALLHSVMFYIHLDAVPVSIGSHGAEYAAL